MGATTDTATVPLRTREILMFRKYTQISSLLLYSLSILCIHMLVMLNRDLHYVIFAMLNGLSPILLYNMGGFMLSLYVIFFMLNGLSPMPSVSLLYMDSPFALLMPFAMAHKFNWCHMGLPMASLSLFMLMPIILGSPMASLLLFNMDSPTEFIMRMPIILVLLLDVTCPWGCTM